MQLEELKTEWQKLERKVELCENLNEKLIHTIISGKSNYILDQMKQKHRALLLILFIEIIALMAVLLGNPFDFRYFIQYLPFVLLIIIILMAAISLFRFHKSIITDLSKNNLKITIQNILNYFSKNKVYDAYFGSISLAIGLLVPWSFLPNKIDNKGWEAGVTDTLIMMVITIIIYLIAFKSGAFKNRDQEKLSDTMNEWNELQHLVHLTDNHTEVG
ncbi:MAG: hypothetical protein H7X99_08390 [Saprospiraceae bacterium]|nr:hypothetical protein [Saprospiraceae bacterium]